MMGLSSDDGLELVNFKTGEAVVHVSAKQLFMSYFVM